MARSRGVLSPLSPVVFFWALVTPGARFSGHSSAHSPSASGPLLFDECHHPRPFIESDTGHAAGTRSLACLIHQG